MAKKRLSPLQQAIRGNSPVTTTSPTVRSTGVIPIGGTRPIQTSSGVSTSRSTGSSSAPSRGPAPAWRQSYFKPTPSLARTVQALSRGVIQEENYDLSAHLGQILESRYDSYRDRLDTRFDNQRAKYEHALNLASIYAKDGKDFEIPEMPKVAGLGRGQGERGLDKALRMALASTSDPDVAENISRYYRYEKERVQSLKNVYRDQRKSLQGLNRDFRFDLEEAVARGDVDKEEYEKILAESQASQTPTGKNRPAVGIPGVPMSDQDGNGLSAFGRSEDMGVYHNAIKGALKSIGGEAKDPLFWTLDKLSRPLYGQMSALDEFMSKENHKSDSWMDEWFGGYSGNFAFDDLDIGDIGDIAGAFKRGFTGKEHTTYGDVLANEGKRDPDKNQYLENKHFQTWVGLGGDLAADPLNLIGVGLVKKPVDAARAVSRARELEKTSEGIAGVVASSQHAASPVGHLADPENVYRLLTANVTKRPRTAAEKRNNIGEVNQNIDYLQNILQTADINMDTRKLATIEGLRKALADRREALVDQFGDDVLSDSIRSGLKTSVQAGKSSPDDLARMEEILDTLESDEIVHLLTPANERDTFLRETAEGEFGASSSYRYVDEEQEYGDVVRTAVDNLDQWQGQHKGVPRADKTTRRIKGEGSEAHTVQEIIRPGETSSEVLETVARADRAVSDAEKALKSFNKSRQGKEAKASSPTSGGTKGYNAAKSRQRELERAVSDAKAARDRLKARNRDKLKRGQAEIETERLNSRADRSRRGVFIPGATTETAKGTKRSAWENVPRTPENESRIAEILDEAGPDFRASLPSRLRDDPRLADFDWDKARRIAYAKTVAAHQSGGLFTKISRKLDKEIKSKRDNLSKLRGEKAETVSRQIDGLVERKRILDNRRDRQQAAIIVRLAKAHIAEGMGMRTYSHGDKAAPLIQELAEIDAILKSRRKGSIDDLGNVVDSAPTPRGPAVSRDAQDTDEITFLDRAEMPKKPLPKGVPMDHIDNPITTGGKGKAPDFSHLSGKDLEKPDPLLPESERYVVPDRTEPSAAKLEELEKGKAKKKPKEAEGSDIYAMDEIELLARRREVEADLKTFEGVGSEGRNSDFLQKNAPEEFVKDGKLDNKALSEVIRFDKNTKLFTIKPGSESEWLKRYQRALQAKYETHWDNLRDRGIMAKVKKEAPPKGTRWSKEYQERYNAAIAETSRKAQAGAIRETEEAFEANRLHESIYSESLDLMIPKQPVEKAVVSEIKSKQAAEKTALLEDKRIATMAGAKEEVARIDAELGELRAKHAEERLIAETAAKQARESKVVMQQRMREEALFRAAGLALAPDRSALAIKMLGMGDLVLPGSGAMLAKGAAINDIPIIKGARQFYADAFKSPASGLTPEGQLLRARAVANTPNIIEHHINKLRHTLGSIREVERNRTFEDMVSNGHVADKGVDPAFDAIKDSFDDLIPFFRNEVPVGDGPLTKADINRYLPKEFRINPNAKIGSMQDLVKAVRNNKANSKYDRKIYKDPYRMSWVMRVAVEQAQARRALEYQIGKSFGIKRGATINRATGKAVKDSITNKEFYDTVEKFGDVGWQLVPRLGNQHYFPKEIVPEVNKLLDMMEPENIHRVGELIDKATRGWKTMTTIYNPGYWTRNGIGEVVSSWFAGVNNPLAYKQAAHIIGYARKDGQEIEELAKHIPGLNVKTDSVKGSRVIYKRPDGDVTADRLWRAYNQMGLKTGFVNTEFSSNFSRTGTAIRDTGGLNTLAKGHDNLRSAGEWYEDYLRMAHFADAIKRHPGKFDEAAQAAAAEVRKYHFDYTDFTKFEKMTMLRAFPFYKWTRKALPLMTTMLFTKPGKVMAYPKIMNALSTQDVARDDNGFAPNYEGIVPGWMQDMWAYKIAEGEDEDETFLNVATPQFDVYKNIASPGSTAYSLLNPYAKVIAEQGAGWLGSNEKGNQTLAGLMRNFDMTDNTDMSIPLDTNDDREWGSRMSQVMRQFPQGNLLQKMGLPKGKLNEASVQDFTSFGTGLGVYLNNDARRDAEEMSQKEDTTPLLRKLYKGLTG